MFFAIFLLQVLRVAGQTPIWGTEGGDWQRTNSITLNLFLKSQLPHSTYTYGEPEEDTVSEVEEALLTSPLVTSVGQVVVMLDSCIISLIEDPLLGGNFVPISSWTPYNDTNAKLVTTNECEAGGMVVGPGDVVYFLDTRNTVVHALNLDPSLGITWKWSSSRFVDTYHASILASTVSMVIINNDLWVPLKYSLEGNDGFAFYLDTATGTRRDPLAPLPSDGCRFPVPCGSAVVDLPLSRSGIMQLSSDDCGIAAYDESGNNVYFLNAPIGAPRFNFEMGQHTHPLYDSASGNLYYVNFIDDVFSGPQMLCCWNTAQQSQCAGWPQTANSTTSGCSVPIPILNDTPEEGITWRFSWAALGFDTLENQLYLVTSGAKNEDVFARLGTVSALSVVDVTTGSILVTSIDNSLVYNSAPLVVHGKDGTQIYLTDATGYLVCYDSGAFGVADGPIWKYMAFPGVPDTELPSSTYAFLSITETGTLLATTSAGGSEWALEKAFSAVVNGVFVPSAPPPPDGSPTATASATASATATATAGAAPPPAGTPTATATSSATSTATSTSTSNANPSNSNSPTPSKSFTPSKSRSSTHSRTATFTNFPPPAPASSASSTGLTPGAAAGVSLLVIALALGAGGYVFVAFFGGGPVLSSALASVQSLLPASTKLAATPAFAASGAGEKTGLLSRAAAEQRLASVVSQP